MKDLTINDFNFLDYNDEPFISGVEICRKLGYKNPKDQAQKIWFKFSDYLKENSSYPKLGYQKDIVTNSFTNCNAANKFGGIV